MKDDKSRLTFGPVPSRRLGKSLGINNIPPKICTYSCIYCQLGRTLKMQTKRQEFYSTEEIVRAAEEKITQSKEQGEHVDYLSFVPDGEPTLDVSLGSHIESLKKFNLKIAVITNASLIDDEEVRNNLIKADWVSLKIDACSESIWHAIDRPHRSLNLTEIKNGIMEFANRFRGTLATETMLISGINDTVEEIEKVADFISELKPTLKHSLRPEPGSGKIQGRSPVMSYLSIPTRPPAEPGIAPAGEYELSRAYAIFRERSIETELLIGYEGNAFAFTGHPEEDLLSITSVHPMKEEAVFSYLERAKTGWNLVETLLDEEKLKKLTYRGDTFYLRSLNRSDPHRN